MDPQYRCTTHDPWGISTVVQRCMAHDPWTFVTIVWPMTHGEKVAEGARYLILILIDKLIIVVVSFRYRYAISGAPLLPQEDGH